MRTTVITVSCLLALANCAFARNPTTRLYGGNREALTAARMQVTCKILGDENFPDNPRYHFEIWAWVPDGYHSLDASCSLSNDQGLLAHHSWRSADGKCVAGFTVGKQALADAWFEVQLWESDPVKSAGWGAAGRYLLKLSEFTGERGAAPSDKEFELTAPIQSGGPALTIAVTHKDAERGHQHDLRISVADRAEQQFDVRTGEPLTTYDFCLGDINGDGAVDITILVGTDERGKKKFKTMIYDAEKEEYRWLDE